MMRTFPRVPRPNLQDRSRFSPRLRCTAVMGLAVLACRPDASNVRSPEGTAPPAEASSSIEQPAANDEVDATVERLADPRARAQAIANIERMALGAETDEQRAVIAKAVVPAFLEIWDDAMPHRLTMLRASLSLLHPATMPLWSRALDLDGSASSLDTAILALQGIQRTRAPGSARAVIDALSQALARPKLAGGDQSGALRVALVQTLEALGELEAVPILMRVLEQPVEEQPVEVHRAAADALGRLRAADAVDALLLTPYRVPDAFTTTNIAERVKQALAAIGEPAVAPTLRMLEGEHEGIQELAARHGIAADNVEITAASYLAAIASPTAVEPLLAHLPREGCRSASRRARRTASEEHDLSMLTRRAVVANALGLIGDTRAIGALCDCATASADPSDMYPIAEALGRIGGPAATACLARVVATATYQNELVAGPEFVHELRWEAARFLILASSVDDVATIEKQLSAPRRRPEVVRNQAQWRPGLDVLRRCGRELPCLLEVLADADAPWFSREVAAVNAARLAPGDESVALELAKASAVPNPDARVTMAWLVGTVMHDRRCQACAEALQHTIDQGREPRLPMQYQLSVLMMRYVIARVRD